MRNRFAFCRPPRCVLASIALTLMAAAPLGAIEGVGTFYLGVKAWGALWDSPYIRIFAREIEQAEQLANAAATIAIEQPVYASSLLPVGLGYQRTYRELDLFH